MFDKATREKALASRKARIEAGAAKYRRDWLDSPTWDLLAKSRGIRLPQWHTPPTPRALKTWRKLPRQADSSEIEFVFASISARKTAGGCLPSASCGLSSLYIRSHSALSARTCSRSSNK